MTPEQMRALASELEGSDFETVRIGGAALRAAADQIEAVRQEVSNYAGWYEYTPEDSWRFERDLRTALGMKQYTGEDDD